MKLFTAVVQAGLVGMVTYLILVVVQAEVENWRWWQRQVKDMRAKTAWKP